MSASVSGQWHESNLQSVLLQNLDFFKPASKNWKIESKAASLREIVHHIETEPGTGILVNRPDATAKDNLQTKNESGDLDLEVEFLMPNNSNSGIYIMGRYEIQLFDSWGKEHPTFGDCGGIYERWDPARGKGKEGFEGFAPLSNECKAPGLWQKLQVSFEAPRFDASGKKIRNARFNSIWLNGQKIHNQLELSGPTRGPIQNDEKPTGPILIQGDHGPIAFRNLRIGEYNGSPLVFKTLNYHVVRGEFKSLTFPPDTIPDVSGSGSLLMPGILNTDDDYYIQYNGILNVTTPGNYVFTALISGMGALLVDGDSVIKSYQSGYYWDRPKGSKYLSAGEHRFKMINAKSDPDKKFALGLTYNGPGIRENRLHGEGSIPTGTGTTTLSLAKEASPFVQRSFYIHQNLRKAYGINVADPSGQHFTLNANTGRLNRIWRSEVLGDVTSMWVDRGAGQLLVPKSAFVSLSDKAVLGAAPESYGDTLTEKDNFKYLGYRQKPGHQPVFQYQTPWGELELQAVVSNRSFVWEGMLKPVANSKAKPYHLVAEGKRIVLLKDGSYLVDDQYYVVPDKTVEFMGKVTDREGMQKLYIQLAGPGTETRFRYGLVW